MRNVSRLLRVGVAAAAVTGLATAGTVSAVADPTPAPPPYRTYAAVGSDTTQDVWNGLANGATPTIADVGSYDAFGSATIQTKSAGATFTRPQGSTNGVKALSAVWDPAYASHDWSGTALVNGEVDFARSSSGPSAGSGLTYLPFARDAVSVAYEASGAFAGLNLTTAELKEIYSGVDDAGDSTVQFPGGSTAKPTVNGVTVTPLIPQQGSGTRSFFQSAIGVSALASYISDPATGGTPENDGSVVDPAELIPFSVAQWIAQRNGVSTNTTAGLSIASVNGQAPTSGTAPSLTPGALYGTKNAVTNEYNTVPVPGVGVFNRDTYNVIPTAFINGTAAQQALKNKLTGSSSGQVGSSAADSVIRTYGFGALSYLATTSTWLSGAYRH
jgi:hypothetical protein